MILVTGAAGQLGTAFQKHFGDGAQYADQSTVDLTTPGAAGAAIRGMKPDIVVNCAAFTAVDRAEAEEDLAYAINATAVEEMAAACAEVGAKFVTYSTDYVFDGSKNGAYVESDPTDPINAYGRTKLIGEQMALDANPDSLVIRTSWVMSGTHRNFAAVMLDLIENGDVTVVADQHGRPTLVDDLVTGSLDAVNAGGTGIVHMANSGSTTWYELARTIASMAGLDPDRVAPCATEDFPTDAARPANSILESERIDVLGIPQLPDFHGSLERVVHELRSS